MNRQEFQDKYGRGQRIKRKWWSDNRWIVFCGWVDEGMSYYCDEGIRGVFAFNKVDDWVVVHDAERTLDECLLVEVRDSESDDWIKARLLFVSWDEASDNPYGFSCFRCDDETFETFQMMRSVKTEEYDVDDGKRRAYLV